MYVHVYSITLHSVTRIVFFFFLRLIWFCNFFRWFCGVIREFCTYLFQLTTVQFPNRNNRTPLLPIQDSSRLSTTYVHLRRRFVALGTPRTIRISSFHVSYGIGRGLSNAVRCSVHRSNSAVAKHYLYTLSLHLYCFLCRLQKKIVFRYEFF